MCVFDFSNFMSHCGSYGLHSILMNVYIFQLACGCFPHCLLFVESKFFSYLSDKSCSYGMLKRCGPSHFLYLFRCPSKRGLSCLSFPLRVSRTAKPPSLQFVAFQFLVRKLETAGWPCLQFSLWVSLIGSSNFRVHIILRLATERLNSPHATVLGHLGSHLVWVITYAPLQLRSYFFSRCVSRCLCTTLTCVSVSSDEAWRTICACRCNTFEFFLGDAGFPTVANDGQRNDLAGDAGDL